MRYEVVGFNARNETRLIGKFKAKNNQDAISIFLEKYVSNFGDNPEYDLTLYRIGFFGGRRFITSESDD